MCKSFMRENSHIISHIALVMDLYSASTEDLDNVYCFFNFQLAKESPMKMQNLLLDLMVFGRDPIKVRKSFQLNR